MRIGCFGITADPPHLGHLRSSHVFLASGLVDQVWFIPSYEHPFEKGESVLWQDRVYMCRLLEGNDLRIATSTAERDMRDLPQYADSKSYTVHVLEYLRKMYPGCEFTWCVGSDIVVDESYKKWHRWDLLEQEHRILVANRGDYPLPDGALPRPFFRLGNVRKVSSSEIRAKIRAGEDIEDLVGERVAEYIKRHRLYLGEKENE